MGHIQFSVSGRSKRFQYRSWFLETKSFIIECLAKKIKNNSMRNISIKGAKTHNLRNLNLELPRNQLIVFTGLSGSGKSSLAFDTIYAEGQRRYVESLSAYARQFLSMMEKPDVDLIEGLSPAISIEQKTNSHNPRSTVGTVTEIYDYLRLLFARAGIPKCPEHNHNLGIQNIREIVDQTFQIKKGSKSIKKFMISINYLVLMLRKNTQLKLLWIDLLSNLILL